MCSFISKQFCADSSAAWVQRTSNKSNGIVRSLWLSTIWTEFLPIEMTATSDCADPAAGWKLQKFLKTFFQKKIPSKLLTSIWSFYNFFSRVLNSRWLESVNLQNLLQAEHIELHEYVVGICFNRPNRRIAVNLLNYFGLRSFERKN